jgi:hypothetical protein
MLEKRSATGKQKGIPDTEMPFQITTVQVN